MSDGAPVVVITGASAGVGRATARRFARELPGKQLTIKRLYFGIHARYSDVSLMRTNRSDRDQLEVLHGEGQQIRSQNFQIRINQERFPAFGVHDEI